VICEYCQQPIDDKRYTYKYFPAEQLMKPVHIEHLQYNTAGKKFPEEPEVKIIPVKDDNDEKGK
jgi:hypothetical protein